jgi:hypothetical protein
MYDELTRIDSPLYLASTVIACWRCGAHMPAVAVIAANVADAEGTICIVSDIHDLPQPILAFIQSRFPTFQFRYSKTTKSKYYANTCPKCGVLSGDFYLHCEPGAPFFPTDEKEAGELSIESIPMKGPVKVAAGLSVGPGELILEHAKRIGAEQVGGHGPRKGR